MNRSEPRGLRLQGLAVQIVLWTVLPLTLVLIGVGFAGVYSHERAMQTLVEERDRALATGSAALVQQVVRERAEPLQKLAALWGLFAPESGAQPALLAGRDAPGGTFAGETALLDSGGELIAAAGETPSWLEAKEVVSALARTVTARQDVSVSPVFASGGQQLVLLGVPVYGESGAMIGLLAGPVLFSSLGFEAILGQADAGEHGTLYLVDLSGQVLAHSPSAHARASFAGHSGMALASQTTEPGATRCQAPEGEWMALAYAPISVSPGWRVLVEQPWHSLTSPVLRYSKFMPLVAALAAVVALLTLYSGIRSLVLPLRALRRQAEQVAWGSFDATNTPVGGVQEIEDLRRTLDQMARRIQSYQRGMHDYIAAITQGQEEERRRLARELHDDTSQSLIALSQQVERAQRLIPTDPERAAERLAEVRATLSETLEGVRRFSRDLRPSYLEDLGFMPALEMLVREAGERQGLAVELTTEGSVRRLPPDLELVAFRIVQEALNNVVQHARAQHAWVRVGFEPHHLLLSVRDDGQGFQVPDQPDSLARQGHFGLMGIQERALLYGGRLELHSAPDQGTEVRVRLQVPAAAEPVAST